MSEDPGHVSGVTVKGPRRLEVWVAGDPEPQGSKVGMLIGWRPGAKHRPQIKLEESGNLKRADGSSNNARAWRSRVELAAKAAMAGSWATLDGPVALTCTFLVPRPASHLKKGGGLVKGAPVLFATSHAVGDVSKLVRAVEDALTEAGVWTDDARVGELHARKLYAATGSPIGVRIVVEELA